MQKALDKMTREELGKLFPILLVSHDPRWKESYEAESKTIIDSIGRKNIFRIHHIGSTSVPGLMAKPTIDILVELRDDVQPDDVVRAIKAIGYAYSPQPQNPPPHMMFMKGYTPEGFRGQAIHVHVRYGGDWGELYFRDYLILHPDAAQAYARMKLALKEQYEFDRDGYTAAKSEFIQDTTRKAREELGPKYKT